VTRETQSLLGDRDPSPAQVIGEGGRQDVLLVGDHAGNAVPSSLGDLGVSAHDRARHIAWDIGVRALGEELAPRLGATFVCQSFSRLVIDCNRDPHVRSSIVETSDGTSIPGNRALDAAAREERRVSIHEPYHRRIALEMDQRFAAGARTALVALHSFTAALGSDRRPWHVGILHDLGDTRLSLDMLGRLRGEPGLTVGDNEPYRMDLTDYTVPRHAYGRRAPYVEVEIRQDLLATADDVRGWAARLDRLLKDALASVAASGASPS
jgi:predicted N-formylglutamate amidohydrolase